MGNFLKQHHAPERPMKWQLFGYMMALALILLTALLIGLMLVGRFSSAREKTFETLELQMQVYEEEVSASFDDLSYHALQLSEELTGILESHLKRNELVFEDLSDSQKEIFALQSSLFAPLRSRLLQAECSGAFVVMDTTINSSIPEAANSKAGLYIQPSGYITADADILLYRGIAEVGEKFDAMPHRKWRQEFHSKLFPNFDELLAAAELPLEKSYRITEVHTIPGTSERAMLVTVPLIGKNGNVYGLCGFEVNESFFKKKYAQATGMEHLICLFIKGTDKLIRTDASMCAGNVNGYYLSPKSDLTVNELQNGLKKFQGNAESYIGVIHNLTLYNQDNDVTLALMIPETDYARAVTQSTLQIGLLLALLVFFMVVCCIFFSRRFLKPVLSSLEKLKNRENADLKSISIPEIEDLFHYLAAEDKAHEDAILQLKQEKQSIESEHARIQSEYEAAQSEIARLAYDRSKEVDPEDYQNFLAGIESLTPTERHVFRHYLEGKDAKEILEILSIKESTLRYHNRNIYQKLGVNSLKQMLRFAALMKQKNSVTES